MVIFLITFSVFTNLFFSFFFFVLSRHHQNNFRSVFRYFSRGNGSKHYVRAGELSGAGCAGCKTAYQIIDDFHKLSAERNNLKKFRQNLTGLADAIINGSFAHPNFLTAFNAPVCD